MLLKRKKIVKTVNLKIWKFSFSVHFSKMSSRHQAMLITIYRIPGFSFFIYFRFQCNTCFQYAISCLLPIFDKLQFVVSICQKASQGTMSCFSNYFLSKNYNRQTPTTADRQLRHAHTETSLVVISS